MAITCVDIQAHALTLQLSEWQSSANLFAEFTERGTDYIQKCADFPMHLPVLGF
jgi:hypothetical protein